MVKVTAVLASAVNEAKDETDFVKLLTGKTLAPESSAAFAEGCKEGILLYWAFQDGDARTMRMLTGQPAKGKWEQTGSSPAIGHYVHEGRLACLEAMIGSIEDDATLDALLDHNLELAEERGYV